MLISKNEHNRVHSWIKKNYGKASCCEFCKSENKKYEWALKKGCEYLKDISCYYQLCIFCHRNYDVKQNHTNKSRIDLTKKSKKHYRTRSVIQMDFNNNVIKVWDSMTDATYGLGVLQSGISNSIRGLSKSCGGFKWKYNENPNDKDRV